MTETTETEPVHWAGSSPTSLHGNGAGSFDCTSSDWREVTCRLCRTLRIRRADDAGVAR